MHDEIAWIQQIAQGDRDAFKKLFDAYTPRVFRYAMILLDHRAAAEETAQETMIAVWKNAKSFGTRSQVSSWILGIARNKALDQLRVQKRAPQLNDERLDRQISHRATPEELAAKEARAERVRHALAQLSPEHREAIMLVFYEELSYSEIAKLQNCPEGTVKSRVYYAKEQLKKLLSVKGGDR